MGRAIGRAEHASPAQRLVAFGFLLAGAGLFVIPHSAGAGELLALASASDSRTLAGLLMIGGGIVAVATGTAGMSRRAA